MPTITLGHIHHASSRDAYAEIAERAYYGKQEVSDSVAATIASWWQSSDAIGAPFAALASGAPTNVDDLLLSIRVERSSVAAEPESYDRTANLEALDMLATWAINYDKGGE